MSLRFHEIAESDRRILNPFSTEKLRLLGELCDVSDGTTVLDVACGAGELLCQWASTFGATGTGVDISEVFIERAVARAADLDVSSRLSFERSDAAAYPIADHDVDVACCIGATWIGGGVRGTIDLLEGAVRDETSVIAVGEAFWTTPPTLDAVAALADGDESTFETLPSLLDVFDDAGYELVEMVLANHDEWDRYEASQWKAVDDWVRRHPDEPEADEIQRWMRDNRRTYLTYGRDCVGWGVFVLRQARP